MNFQNKLGEIFKHASFAESCLKYMNHYGISAWLHLYGLHVYTYNYIIYIYVYNIVCVTNY